MYLCVIKCDDQNTRLNINSVKKRVDKSQTICRFFFMLRFPFLQGNIFHKGRYPLSNTNKQIYRFTFFSYFISTSLHLMENSLLLMSTLNIDVLKVPNE